MPHEFNDRIKIRLLSKNPMRWPELKAVVGFNPMSQLDYNAAAIKLEFENRRGESSDIYFPLEALDMFIKTLQAVQEKAKPK